MSSGIQINLIVLSLCFLGALGQSYEDKRCRCVCPSPAAALNTTMNTTRKLFIANVPPNKCNCYGVIIPLVGVEIKGHEQEYCPRCDCKYETRNTTIILVVVVMVMWVLMLLAVYMGFLLCLDPLIKKKRVLQKSYRESNTEEACNLLIQGEDED